MSDRKNINRGYQKLSVWQDAAEWYVLTSKIFRKFNYELSIQHSNIPSFLLSNIPVFQFSSIPLFPSAVP
jgi:hypothetical protein